jgi:hypothetical protein
LRSSCTAFGPTALSSAGPARRRLHEQLGAFREFRPEAEIASREDEVDVTALQPVGIQPARVDGSRRSSDHELRRPCAYLGDKNEPRGPLIQGADPLR